MIMFKVDKEILKRHGLNATDDLFLEKDEVSVDSDFCVVKRSQTKCYRTLHSVDALYGISVQDVRHR